jgi:hypothetical protein
MRKRNWTLGQNEPKQTQPVVSKVEPLALSVVEGSVVSLPALSDLW